MLDVAFAVLFKREHKRKENQNKSNSPPGPGNGEPPDNGGASGGRGGNVTL